MNSNYSYDYSERGWEMMEKVSYFFNILVLCIIGLMGIAALTILVIGIITGDFMGSLALVLLCLLIIGLLYHFRYHLIGVGFIILVIVLTSKYLLS